MNVNVEFFKIHLRFERCLCSQFQNKNLVSSLMNKLSFKIKISTTKKLNRIELMAYRLETWETISWELQFCFLSLTFLQLFGIYLNNQLTIGCYRSSATFRIIELIYLATFIVLFFLGLIWIKRALHIERSYIFQKMNKLELNRGFFHY